MLKQFTHDIKKIYLFYMFVPILFAILLGFPLKINGSESILLNLLCFVVFMAASVYMFLNVSHYLLFKRSLNYFGAGIFKSLLYFFKPYFIFLCIMFIVVLITYMWGGSGKEAITNTTSPETTKKAIDSLTYFSNQMKGSQKWIILLTDFVFFCISNFAKVFILMTFFTNFFNEKYINSRLYVIYSVFQKTTIEEVNEIAKKSYYTNIFNEYRMKIYMGYLSLVLIDTFLGLYSKEVYELKIGSNIIFYLCVLFFETFLWYMSWKTYEDLEGYKTSKKEKKKESVFSIDLGTKDIS